MNPLKSPRVHWLLWVAAVGVFVNLLLYPVSYRFTRLAGLGLVVIIWFGLIALVWRWPPLRWALLAVTALAAGFFALPSRGVPPSEDLRNDYIANLSRYDGVTYYWGGESIRGIDCSGLVRRGLIDALLSRGIRRVDPGPVRQAIGLWWNDCTARALSEEHQGLTVRVLETPSINALDHSKILPGDLAVTKTGIHVLAYLGDHRWIEADPAAGKVITVPVPSTYNPWSHTPVTIVRWSRLK